MTIQYLPLSKLVPSPDNVRKTDRLSGIEQLAASIEAHGLLQNLQVKPNSQRPVRGRCRWQTACSAETHGEAEEDRLRFSRAVQRARCGKPGRDQPCRKRNPPSHASRRPVRRLQGAGRSEDERRRYRRAVRRTVARGAAAAQAGACQSEADCALPQGRNDARLPHGFRHQRRSQAAGKNLERPARMVEGRRRQHPRYAHRGAYRGRQQAGAFRHRRGI